MEGDEVKQLTSNIDAIITSFVDQNMSTLLTDNNSGTNNTISRASNFISSDVHNVPTLTDEKLDYHRKHDVNTPSMMIMTIPSVMVITMTIKLKH